MALAAPLSSANDGSGSGSERISVGFGFAGFSFGAWLSPTDFRVWIPKILWVWGRSLISPVDLHRTSKVQFTRSQTSNPKYISLESSLNLSAQPHPT
jgi:hypothetical protein